ncbi:uncharacterized protein LOC108030515 [Drosophila biarmipes]|uniref:uncharacterized protein LOC108030515 n=1 Tax=Drosophila biarmipes TaxID=125945 RepID=UPI0007E67510|nr:uncharacterized protein LOC108030515 [Drosophila biarmipes]
MDTRRKWKRFGRQTYATFAMFLAVALGQWIIVCLVESGRKIFRDFEEIGSATLALAGIIFTMFAFNQNVRVHRIYKWIVAFVLVELEIFSMYVLVARSWLPDMLAFYFICVLLIVVVLVIGCHLSFTMDLTQFIAPLFIMSFILVTFSAYFLMSHLFLPDLKCYGYMFFEIFLTLVMLLMATLHAQTINGDRHVQMSLDDFILAALLLFHEFLAIYALTFYWQINYNYFTSTDFFWMSTSTKDTHGTTAMHRDYDDYDDKPNEEEWKIDNMTNYDWAAEDWEISNGKM